MKKFIIFITVLLLAPCFISSSTLPSEIMLYEDIEIEWGKGASCRGRAICYINEASSEKATTGKILYSKTDEIVQLFIPKEKILPKDAEYYFGPGHIAIDKVSNLKVENYKLNIEKGNYSIHENKKGYLLILDHNSR